MIVRGREKEKEGRVPRERKETKQPRGNLRVKISKTGGKSQRKAALNELKLKKKFTYLNLSSLFFFFLIYIF